MTGVTLEVAVLQSIERVAELSIARGCGFAGLGIFTFMVGLSWDPVLAFKAGGLATMLACAVLVIKAHYALSKPYKRTELWVILPPDLRPRAEVAQQVIGSVLREVCLRFATHAALLSSAMLFISLVLSLIS